VPHTCATYVKVKENIAEVSQMDVWTKWMLHPGSFLTCLPVDFYKSFWSELGEDLLEVLNESLAEGQLPLSCRRAVLTLLPKKGDLADIKCWRPVSLLCSDYKLLSLKRSPTG